MRKVLIIGGSLGGLLAANLLHRAGWDVHVHERVAEELEGRGAGLVTHPELMDVLAAAGVKADSTIGVAVDERVAFARDGSVERRSHLPQVFTSWSRLYMALRNAFPRERYHNGRQLASFREDGSGVTAVFSDGSEQRGDLLVAADGIRSTVRQMVMPEAKPVYAGYVGWRGLVEESVLSERVRADVLPYFGFGLPPREQFIAYPVAGRKHTTAPGQRRFNFVWYRPADEGTELKAMLTDASGKVWPDGIPPPLIRPEVLAGVRQAARDVLAPQFAEVVQKTEPLFFQPIQDLESDQLAFGHVALLGDAAFVARPHCGMGVTKAAGDARDLVAALATHADVREALKAYESKRVEFGRFIVGHARALGTYMQAQVRTPQEHAMAESYRTAEAVMRETAVSPSDH